MSVTDRPLGSLVTLAAMSEVSNCLMHCIAHYTAMSALLTLRRLMSYIYIYIYGAPILDVSRSHTTTQHSR